MAQIHLDDYDFKPRCTAEIWPVGAESSSGVLFKTAVLLLGENITLSITDQEEFNNLLDGMNSTKSALGW